MVTNFSNLFNIAPSYIYAYNLQISEYIQEIGDISNRVRCIPYTNFDIGPLNSFFPNCKSSFIPFHSN